MNETHSTANARHYPGKVVRRMRDALGWTQEHLAEKAGLTPESISQIETGARHGRPETLSAVAGALGVPVDELHRTDDESIPAELASFLASPQGRGVSDTERAHLRSLAFPGRRMTEQAYSLALAMLRATEEIVGGSA